MQVEMVDDLVLQVVQDDLLIYELDEMNTQCCIFDEVDEVDDEQVVNYLEYDEREVVY
jgi:hypothetical protein